MAKRRLLTLLELRLSECARDDLLLGLAVVFTLVEGSLVVILVWWGHLCCQLGTNPRSLPGPPSPVVVGLY